MGLLPLLLALLPHLPASSSAAAYCCSLCSLDGLEALTGLVALSLADNQLTTVAPLAALTRLTRLSLAGNPLRDLASQPLLPSLLHLDVSGCHLSSLDGLGAAAPLLLGLAASGNRLSCLPADLGLLFLRELWLPGNQIGPVARWPWLPSLQALHLQDNAVSSLAPTNTLASLTCLDLSFNALADLGCLWNLAPLTQLRHLLLHDNPLAGEAGDSYAAAVHQALPRLHELDSQPIPASQRQRHLQQVARQAIPGTSPSSTDQLWDRGRAWDASTVVWMASHPEPVWLAGALAGQRSSSGGACRTGGEGGGSSRSGCNWWASGTSGCSSSGGGGASIGSSRSSTSQAAGRAPGFPGFVSGLAELQGLPELATLAHSRQQSGDGVAEMRQRYCQLAAAQVSAHQNMLVVNSAYYRGLLQALTQATTSIQRWWRGGRARELCRRFRDERLARRQSAAAALIQAAWRGRHTRRQTSWVTSHLADWREQWRRAQALLELHQRVHAATLVQVGLLL